MNSGTEMETMTMQETIDAIEKAKWEVVAAIHRAGRAFDTHSEYPVLLGRLQDCLKTLEETKNQAVRIKSAADSDPGEPYFAGRDSEFDAAS